MSERLLGIKELMEKLNVSRSYINRYLINNDEFPKPLRLSMNVQRAKRLWRESDIDKWIAAFSTE